MTDTFEGYVTKYALTSGIVPARLRVCAAVSMNMVEVVGGMHHQCFFGEGREWHRTRESALRRAEEMRVAKIASLRKSTAKMEELRFL